MLKSFFSSWDQEYRQMRLGLDRIKSVLRTLQGPEKAFPCILIAGTNGKGSVAHMLESILCQAGYRVGLATSPHLQKINERIRIHGTPVEDSFLEKILQILKDENLLKGDDVYSQDGEKLTWFEKIAVLSLEAFRQAKVDIALLEIGLGGRFDAFNAVEPMLSIISSIDLDHTEVLGHSIFEIAREKAGVMRPNQPVILGHIPEEVRNFLNLTARITKAVPIRTFTPKGNPQAFFYRHYEGLKLGITGSHQLHNAATAIETVLALREQGLTISDKAIQGGLANVKIPGRLELIKSEPSILLDVAHNAQAMRGLAEFIQKNFPDKKITFLLAMLREKNVREILKILKPLGSKWVVSQVTSSRSLTCEEWQRTLNFEDISISAEIFKEPQPALERALNLTDQKDLLVVTGSFYLVGEVRERIY